MYNNIESQLMLHLAKKISFLSGALNKMCLRKSKNGKHHTGKSRTAAKIGQLLPMGWNIFLQLSTIEKMPDPDLPKRAFSYKIKLVIPLAKKFGIAIELS